MTGLAGNSELWVDYDLLMGPALAVERVCGSLKELTENIRGLAERIPFYMKGHDAIYHSIKLSARELDKYRKDLQKTEGFVRYAAKSYKSWDKQC